MIDPPPVEAPSRLARVSMRLALVLDDECVVFRCLGLPERGGREKIGGEREERGGERGSGRVRVRAREERGVDRIV